MGLMMMGCISLDGVVSDERVWWAANKAVYMVRVWWAANKAVYMVRVYYL
jgi:hypothetical protein